jgi:hypothetical protein
VLAPPVAAAGAPPLRPRFRLLEGRRPDASRAGGVQVLAAEGIGGAGLWLPWTTLSLQRAMISNQPIFLLVTVPWNRAAQRWRRRRSPTRSFYAPSITITSLLVSADRRPTSRPIRHRN